MTLSKSNSDYLTEEEWNELDALRKAINYNPASVHPEKQERFTELFVRSLRGKGDCVLIQTK
jgi:hypothetical protein